MKNVLRSILFFLAFFWIAVSPGTVWGASCTMPSSNVSPEEIQAIIDECARLVGESHQQVATLNQQISVMDNQIKIAVLKISQTEAQIKILEKEIDVLSGKITRLNTSLDFLSKILLSRISENYKTKRVNPLNLFFSSESYTDFISRYRYLQKAQLHDRQLLISMEQTRLSYDEQKALKEKAQADLANLNIKLVSQKKQLAVQMGDKKQLLDQTKGKEAEYQRILASARAEQETILKSMQESVLKLADGTKVEKGQQIALIGNTGYPCCSTGSHLHFMVTTGCQRDDKGFVKGCSPVNPSDYLKNSSVAYQDKVVAMTYKGDWDWPIDNPEITQEYGMSYWARTGYYGGKPHNGIDMVNSSTIIKAPREGVLYRQSTSCGACNGKCCATVNFVALDHGDGVYSWYWHVK